MINPLLVTRWIRRSLRGDAGSALIEVVTSAALVLVISTATLRGFDGASDVSGQQQSQAIAGNLAADEQERIRALPLNQVVGLSETNTVTVRAVPYTVVSVGTNIPDQPGGCAAAAGRPEAVLIATTVTWPRGDTRRVKLESVVATGPQC